MKAEIEQSPANNPNPVLRVANDGIVLYSNVAGEPLLHKLGVGVREKLPSFIGDIVQRVISRNSSEKMEINVGKRVYLVTFHPSPEEECVNIYGFDISDQKELEKKLRESENKYRHIVETSVEGIWIFNAVSETTHINEKMAQMLGYNREEMIGRFIWDFANEEEKGIFQVKLANRKQGIDEVYELKLIRKDGSPLWVSVSAKGFFDDVGKFEGSVGMFTDITDRKRAEQELQESEERFRSAFDDSAVSMALVGPDASFLKVNDAFCQLLGFEKSEMENLTFLDITYPDDIEPSILIHKAVINSEKPFLWIEKRYIRKDGRVIWCEVSSSPVRDSKGCPIYTVAHIQDITERKEAEEGLKKAHETLEENVKERTKELEEAYKSMKESEGRLVEAQRIAHIGNWNWNIVTNGLYWSDEIYRIFGRSPQEFGATYDAFLSYVHPNNREYVNNAVIEALNGKPYSIDHRIILANGEERIVHEQGEVIFDEKNIPVRMMGTVQDITEYKMAEEALELSEEKYRSFIQNFKGIAFQLDKDLNLEFMKGDVEEITGYSEEELIFKKLWKEIIEPEDLPLCLEGALEIKNSTSAYEGEIDYRIKSKDGKIKWLHEIYQKIRGKDGIPDKYQGVIYDVTERKNAEEFLANIETARKKEIHHRIKNNLQVISSLLDLQAEQFEDRKDIMDSEVLDAFRESQDRVISMALIHEELYKGGGIDTLDFSSYIEELADSLFLTYRIGDKDISLNMDLEKNLLFDMDTAVPLGIIVNELVSNALKHAFSDRTKGEIRIKLCREKSVEFVNEDCKSTSFTLTVSDNGIGIPELDIEDLDSLGLQLVTSLVDQLDGKLELKRNNGTEFKVRFTV